MENVSNPVFVNNKDIQTLPNGRITEYDMMEAVSEAVGDKILCVQLDRSLWHIYLVDESSRQELVVQGIELHNQNITVHDKNPFLTRSIKRPHELLKVTVSGVPLSVDNSEIENMLTKLGAKLKSKVEFDRIRNPHTREMTAVLNGKRSVHIEPLPENKSLPRKSYCSGRMCSIYHYGQPKVTPPKKCRICWSDQHFTHECKEGPKCKVCLQSGHKPGDEDCPKYHKQHPPSVIMFQGKENVLSNFFPCSLQTFGEQFPSAEHAFQCSKALQSGDLVAAEKIRAAESALEAKQIGSQIPPSTAWSASKEKTMEEIIRCKAEQVEQFRNCLTTAKNSATFVEATYDDFWGTGLNLTQTMHTKSSAWPGKNTLGQIIGRVAGDLKKSAKNKLRSGSTPAPSSNTRQRDISVMLQVSKDQNTTTGN